MLTRHPVLARLQAQDGFTLIEVLVATSMSLVISFAAFTLLQVATDQSARATDYLQASQLGRNAMSHIVDALNSACVSEGAAPIQESSSGEKLVFVTGFSKKTEIKPAEVQRNEIKWEAIKGKVGRLVDVKAPAEKEVSSGEYQWGKSSTVELDPAVDKPENAKGETQPIFKYYKYGTETTESSESGVTSLTEIAAKSSAEELKAEAKKVASTSISFRSLPVDRSEKVGRDLDLSNQVTFAFSAGFTEPALTSSKACE
jgi:prepilin-type N-terminal cleavage/methylation domain-containing protein